MPASYSIRWPRTRRGERRAPHIHLTCAKAKAHPSMSSVETTPPHMQTGRPAGRPVRPTRGHRKKRFPVPPRHLRTNDYEDSCRLRCCCCFCLGRPHGTGRHGTGPPLSQASRSLFASKHKWPGSTGCRIFRPQFRGPSRRAAPVPGPFTASPSAVFRFACFAAKHLWQPEAGAWTTKRGRVYATSSDPVSRAVLCSPAYLVYVLTPQLPVRCIAPAPVSRTLQDARVPDVHISPKCASRCTYNVSESMETQEVRLVACI
jgi:hypothetical protein